MNDVGNPDVNFDLLMLELREKIEAINKENKEDPLKTVVSTVIDTMMWDIIKESCRQMGTNPTSRDFAKVWVTAIAVFTTVSRSMPPLFMIVDGKPFPVSLDAVTSDLARVVFSKYEEKS